MTRLVLILALLPATAVAGTHSENSAACVRNQPQLAQGTGKAGFQRLDTLPPANEQLTVIRSVDGCQKPVIVRYGIGGTAKAAAPIKP